MRTPWVCGVTIVLVTAVLLFVMGMVSGCSSKGIDQVDQKAVLLTEQDGVKVYRVHDVAKSKDIYFTTMGDVTWGWTERKPGAKGTTYTVTHGEQTISGVKPGPRTKE